MASSSRASCVLPSRRPASCMGTAVSYQFRDLLADDLRLLGPDYPDTLTTAATSPAG